MMWKKKRPAGVLVSMPSVRLRKCTSAILERIHEIHQPFYAPPQAIQLPNDKGITGTQVRECIIEARSNQSRTAGFVCEYPVTA